MKVLINGSFSDLMEVLSGVPQGSVLGPLLFLLFVNDLPDWIISSMIMFADDIKLWRIIKTTNDSQILQRDLDALMNWSNKYLLKFNPQKCKLVCIGQSGSAHREYYLQEETGKYKLQETTEERDFGVMVMRNLHSRVQCSKAATKARSVLGMVKRNFRRLDEDFLLIYKTYVRPHLA